MRTLAAAEIATLVGGAVRGEQDRMVQRVTALDTATSDSLSFVASPRYLSYLQATQAGVVFVKEEWLDAVPTGCTAIVVADPHQALQVTLSAMYPRARPTGGVHPTAVVDPSARVAEGATVGPYVVIEANAEIGPAAVIGAHSVISAGCRIGRDVTIDPHVTLYEGVVVGDRAIIHSGARVGKEGFGYVWRDGGHRKIPQVGGCVIGDDVEIGANVAIDRGSVGDTVIGAGTKIDNLVHLGHNVRIGQHVLLLGHVGISGSTTVGDGAILAGQSGVGGHLTIGAGARIGGQAGVTADVPAGLTYSGYPARPHREAMKAQAGLFRLPLLLERIKRLEATVFGERTNPPSRRGSDETAG